MSLHDWLNWLIALLCWVQVGLAWLHGRLDRSIVHSQKTLILQQHNLIEMIHLSREILKVKLDAHEGRRPPDEARKELKLLIVKWDKLMAEKKG